MVDYRVQPCVSPLVGVLRVPSDKSISHRALLLSSVAQGESLLYNLLTGADNQAMMQVLQEMGVAIEQVEDSNQSIKSGSGLSVYRVAGVGLHGLERPKEPLDLGNSGTGMRLLAGVLAGQPFESVIVGDASLMRRPMKRIVEPLREMGARIDMSAAGTAPLHILPSSTLRGIDYKMPIASAQVKSCLLLAGLYAQGETRIIESAITRDHTERLLQTMGYSIKCRETSHGCRIALLGGGVLQGTTINVPADISSAAFFIVAATLIPNSDILLTQVGVNPTRIGVITILRAMGADITLMDQSDCNGEPVADIRVRSAKLHGIDIPVDQVPLAIDELPVILVAASCAEGKTVLKGAAELRVKESDRIAAMAKGLSALGITVEVLLDGIIVEGGTLQGGVVDSFMDHRIAMSFVVAASVAPAQVVVHRCENVDTSFPNFKEIAGSLGLSIKELNVTQ